MPNADVDRLVDLASNFNEAIEPLPEKEQDELLEGQHQIAKQRRDAQSSDDVLRLRVK